MHIYICKCAAGLFIVVRAYAYIQYCTPSMTLVLGHYLWMLTMYVHWKCILGYMHVHYNVLHLPQVHVYMYV